MIDGLSDEMIRRQVIPGKWSIFEHIIHLQTYQHTFISRIKQLLQGNNPSFPRYTAETDPSFTDNCYNTVREIIQDLLSIRKQMHGEINSFPDSDLSKTAIHPVFGKMTMAEWLNFFLLHEAHQMFVIFKLAGEHRKVN
jgi:uncharacterized damage-inducible protein DinB